MQRYEKKTEGILYNVSQTLEIETKATKQGCLSITHCQERLLEFNTSKVSILEKNQRPFVVQTTVFSRRSGSLGSVQRLLACDGASARHTRSRRATYTEPLRDPQEGTLVNRNGLRDNLKISHKNNKTRNLPYISNLRVSPKIREFQPNLRLARFCAILSNCLVRIFRRN